MEEDYRSKKHSVEKTDMESSIKEMTDLALQTFEEEARVSGDSFDVYSNNLKSHMHTDLEKFKCRFQEGYRTLLEILEKTSHYS